MPDLTQTSDLAGSPAILQKKNLDEQRAPKTYSITLAFDGNQKSSKAKTPD
jgi:hypothetical protein